MMGGRPRNRPRPPRRRPRRPPSLLPAPTLTPHALLLPGPQAEFDTHDEENARRKLSFLRKRSKVVEVVAAQDLIFALTRTGVCAVFSRGERFPCPSPFLLAPR